MMPYILRRFVQAIFTVFGVMLLTFILFRVIAGDVSTAYVNQKLGREARQAFYEKHKLDRPSIFNFHKRLILKDKTQGRMTFKAIDVDGSKIVSALNIQLALPNKDLGEINDQDFSTMESRPVWALSQATALKSMSNVKPLLAQSPAGDSLCAIRFLLSDSTDMTIRIGSENHAVTSSQQ